MKKLTYFFVILFIAAHAFGQEDVTVNAKNFIVNGTDGSSHFKFTTDVLGDPEMQVGRSIQNLGTDVFMLNLQSASFGPFISFASFTTTVSGSAVWFHKAKGVNGDVVQGDELGVINFAGFKGAAFHPVATILSRVTDPGTNSPAAEIRFSTSLADQSAQLRMTIKSNGAIHFTPMANDPAGTAEAGDVYYNSTDNKLKVYNGTGWVDLN